MKPPSFLDANSLLRGASCATHESQLHAYYEPCPSNRSLMIGPMVPLRVRGFAPVSYFTDLE